MNRFLIIIFILVVAFGVYQWQTGTYSKEALRIEILGPTEVTLAEEVEYIIKYKNNGDFRLEEPELVFEAPENTLRDEEIFHIKVFDSEELGGTIYPGEERNISIRVRLFGKEGDTKIAKASISYKPKDLKARYESSSSFSTRISSVPLTLSFDLPSNVNEDKNFDFKLNYFSNVEYPLIDLRCQIDYPSGFEFISSSPYGMENVEWDISVLNKSEGGGINITGSLSGSIGDVKIFKAKIGIWKDGQFIVLKETSKGIEIVKSSIYLQQEINGNPEHVTSVGELLHYKIYFKNIGDKSLTNLFMVNQFEDSVLDFTTTQSNDGDYQEGGNSIVFDWKNIPKLQYLSPLEEGKVEFWIRVREDLGNVKNPLIQNTIFIGQTTQTFSTKVKSKLQINQRGYYEDEVFGNKGPIEPEEGKETTYTIIWNPKTIYSDVQNVKVRTFLPDNVELTGEIFPETELSNFTFDSETREIVWSAGDLERGEENLSIAFQIKITPEEYKEENILLEETIITGYDSWVESNLSLTHPVFTSNLIEDLLEEN